MWFLWQPSAVVVSVIVDCVTHFNTDCGKYTDDHDDDDDDDDDDNDVFRTK